MTMALRDLAAADEAKLKFRVIIVGEAFVGKTSLLERFRSGRFVHDLQANIGITHWAVKVNVQEREVKIDVFDTPGNEQQRDAIRASYFQADAAVVVYNVSDRQSFDGIRTWLLLIRERAPANIKLFLVGAKLDLNDIRQVDIAAGRELALNEGMTFMEASSKTGENVEFLFCGIAQRLVETAQLEGRCRRLEAQWLLLEEQQRQTEARQQRRRMCHVL